MKSWWGDTATAENNFGFDYLPKLDKSYDMLQVFELMNQGKMNGYIAQGFNPLAAAPNKAKIGASLSKLKWLVIMDPLATETSEFWKNFGEFNDVDPATIQTEVFRLPTTCFAEERGSLVSSSRVLQWHWQGAEPARAKRGAISRSCRACGCASARRIGRTAASIPIRFVKMSWPYADPESPTPEEIAMEFNGKALADVTDPTDKTKVLAKKGEQLASFAQLRDDGSTASGCWIFCGAWTQAGNQMGRRDNSDPTGIGQTLNWAWAWPANRRILYNRASCDVSGKPFDPTRKLIAWNGKTWSGRGHARLQGRTNRPKTA